MINKRILQTFEADKRYAEGKFELVRRLALTHCPFNSSIAVLFETSFDYIILNRLQLLTEYGLHFVILIRLDKSVWQNNALH